MLLGDVMLMVTAAMEEDGGLGLAGGVSVSKMSPRSPTDTVLISEVNVVI